MNFSRKFGRNCVELYSTTTTTTTTSALIHVFVVVIAPEVRRPCGFTALHTSLIEMIRAFVRGSVLVSSDWNCIQTNTTQIFLFGEKQTE